MRPHLVALSAALMVGCASQQRVPDAPPPASPVPAERLLSPDAAAFFAHAEAPGSGGSLVVNLDALEALGVEGKGRALRQLAGFAASSLPQWVPNADEGDRDLLARGAVAATVLRQWAEWPSARRVGVLVSPRLLLGGADAPQDEVVVALAVDEGSPDNAKLLVGLAALGRAVQEERARDEDPARLMLAGADLCVEGAGLKAPMCLRPRGGLLLLGSPAMLDAVEARARVTGGAGFATAAPTGGGAPAPLLLGLRMSLEDGRSAHVTFTGRDAVHLEVGVEGVRSSLRASIESMVGKFLRDYDEREAEKRARVTAALADVRASLARQFAAPEDLRRSVDALTVDAVVDADGHWARMRQSIQARPTLGGYALSLTVPAGLVRDFAEMLNSGVLAAGSLGLVAAHALPELRGAQTRAREAEVKAQLKTAYTLQRLYAREHKRHGSLREIGFAPEPGLYTFCQGTECLPCKGKDCAWGPHTLCADYTSVGKRIEDGFSICACGNQGSDLSRDVWVIDREGKLSHVSNGAP
ncbi:hypothetical protein P2318_03975 [Myxococcaceae bacterium GXIMD 01537]